MGHNISLTVLCMKYPNSHLTSEKTVLDVSMATVLANDNVRIQLQTYFL